jgi:hypothetical protein
LVWSHLVGYCSWSVHFGRFATFCFFLILPHNTRNCQNVCFG